MANNTVAYLTPGAGTVPATAAQAKTQSIQVAEVTFADADTTCLVTHNFGLGTTGASPTTAQDLPKVNVVMKTAGTGYPALSYAWTDGNTVTITKGATSVGTACVAVVYLERPHSIVGPK